MRSPTRSNSGRASERRSYFPSPLVGEGGSHQAKRDARRVRGLSPRIQTLPPRHLGLVKAGHDDRATQAFARDQFARLPSSAAIATIIIARPPKAAPPSSNVNRNEIPAIRFSSDSALLSASGGRKYLRTTTGFVRAAEYFFHRQ
jgi:hypothetical protein